MDLLEGHERIKLVDMGFVSQLPGGTISSASAPSACLPTGGRGSRVYLPPEVLSRFGVKRNMLNTATDVWALACILIEFALRMADLWNPDCRSEDQRMIWPTPGPVFESEFAFPLDHGQCDCNRRSLSEKVLDGLDDDWETKPLSVVVEQMSPEAKEILRRNADDDGEQLNIIFDLLGTPTASETKHLDSILQHYISLFVERPSTLETVLKVCGDNFISLIKSALAFEPAKRSSIEEMIAHPYFDDVRHVRQPVPSDGSQVLLSDLRGADGALDVEKIRTSMRGVMAAF
uniref:Protein kinase domain-containing protein n=1 Tax=Chromera velia CCMP2878 TaxID=1169474 RepID=A0A0G4FG50_9ALVE|eukprot:Cvel_16793.t1-p1 / transcript=Cvel_16793.t1 / gene=Cvel_16793 / organism=Chromera_velia_CCMP2878 / gene_product=hypothetical protein / transcript_product=hypothetical protein / location=Cvel_scaffold1311:18362-21070(-) / protein_length=288 / sequence_SO=supercontig / SO=protein_coding / is_pseudo=false